MNETRLKELFCRYLKARGIDSERIKENSTKTPDLLLKNGSTRIFCEFKAPELHVDAKLGLYKWKTTLHKLHDHYRRAVKQFQSVDPWRRYPRLLVLTSCDMQLHLHVMRDAMQGYLLDGVGTLLTDFRRTHAFGRWLGSFGEIDAILWLQLNPEREEYFQAGYFIHQASPWVTIVQNLFCRLRLQPVGEADLWVVMAHGFVYGPSFRAAPNCSFQRLTTG